MSTHDVTPYTFALLQVGLETQTDNLADAEPAPPPGPTPEQFLENAREEAMAQGREAGFAEGKKAGFEVGYADGMAQGLDEGLAQGRVQAEEERHSLAALATLLSGWEQQAAQMLEQNALALALSLARAVLRREVQQVTPQLLEAQLRTLIAELGLAQVPLRISAHPDDVQMLQQWDAWRPVLDTDATLERGGFRVRRSLVAGENLPDLSAFSEWDARIETLWHDAVSRLLGGDV